ncbi:MAG: S8 family serine peptidase, partial [Nitrosarchaeum sp.]|nr:S8 family serine peptidase [Nitrosarchaeum sp.]
MLLETSEDANKNDSIFVWKIILVILIVAIIGITIYGITTKSNKDTKQTSQNSNTELTKESRTNKPTETITDGIYKGFQYESSIILYGLKQGIDTTSIQTLEKYLKEDYGMAYITKAFPDIDFLADVYEVEFTTDVDELAIITRLQNDPAVDFAELNYYAQYDSLPTDPYFVKTGNPNQWNMNLIDMPRAWEITKGSPNVVVAVIDGGVDHTHPDLVGGVIEGYDTQSGKAFNDDCYYGSHGTHVAGIIGARENGLGIVGVAPNVKIISLAPKTCPEGIENNFFEYDPVWVDRNFSDRDIITLVSKAINSDTKIDIINMSFGGPYSKII